jgi:hypothetical protein
VAYLCGESCVPQSVVSGMVCDVRNVMWSLCKMWRMTRAVASVQNVTRDTCYGLCAKCDTRHVLWPVYKMWRATRVMASVQNVPRDTWCGLCAERDARHALLPLQNISTSLNSSFNLQMKIIIISSVYEWFTDMQILTWSEAVWNSVNKAVGVLWALLLVKGLRCQVRRLWESRRL